jgi:hypothetical protein
MVAFNTSSGIPVTYVQFQNAEGRANSGQSDGGTNAAEAGTISMEFTTIGRLLGKQLAGNINSTRAPWRCFWHCCKIAALQACGHCMKGVCGDVWIHSSSSTMVTSYLLSYTYSPATVYPQLCQRLTHICHESSPLKQIALHFCCTSAARTAANAPTPQPHQAVMTCLMLATSFGTHS